MMRAELFETSQFATDAADRIRAAMGDALAARGECVIGLCGGSTPAPVYAALAGSGLPWERVLFTFGDERCVGPDDPQSNFRMAQRAWFEPAAVPAGRVLRMRGELAPETAAADYAAQLETQARRLGHPEARLVHDVLLLGMGDDGHTASLFPGTAALAEAGRDVVANFVPKFDAWRLTLTYPALNRARAVFFLVNDPAKRPVVDAIRAGGSGFPAENVRPHSGALAWVVGG